MDFPGLKLCQHLVLARVRGPCFVHGQHVHHGSGGHEFFRQHVAGLAGARQQHLDAGHVRAVYVQDALGNAFGHVFFRHKIRSDAARFQGFGRCRADGRHSRAEQIAGILAEGVQLLPEVPDSVHRGKNRQRIAGEPADDRARFAVVRQRSNLDGGKLDDVGAHFRQQGGAVAGLFPRPGDHDALAQKRPLLEPAQLVMQADHAADDNQAGRGKTMPPRLLRQLA